VRRFGARASRQGVKGRHRSARPRKKTPRPGGATCGLDSIESPAGSGGIRIRRIGGRVKVSAAAHGASSNAAVTRVVRWGFGSIGRDEPRESEVVTSGVE
jgi:hypothetical protein